MSRRSSIVCAATCTRSRARSASATSGGPVRYARRRTTSAALSGRQAARSCRSRTRRTTVRCENLEVTFPGTARGAEIIVAGAHYDTVPGSPGADGRSACQAEIHLAIFGGVESLGRSDAFFPTPDRSTEQRFGEQVVRKWPHTRLRSSERIWSERVSRSRPTRAQPYALSNHRANLQRF